MNSAEKLKERNFHQNGQYFNHSWADMQDKSEFVKGFQNSCEAVQIGNKIHNISEKKNHSNQLTKFGSAMTQAVQQPFVLQYQIIMSSC